MRLLITKIAVMLLLCFAQNVSVFSQPATPPPPVPPPPPGLPINDYVPYMVFLALVIGIFYFVKFKDASKPSNN